MRTYALAVDKYFANVVHSVYMQQQPASAARAHRSIVYKHLVVIEHLSYARQVALGRKRYPYLTLKAINLAAHAYVFSARQYSIVPHTVKASVSAPNHIGTRIL